MAHEAGPGVPMTVVLLTFCGGLLLGVLASYAYRRRKRSAGWRRFLWAGGTGVSAALSALFVAAGCYGYWYTHRPQPDPTRRALFEGIEYVREIRQRPRPMVIHVARIDLSAPGLSFLVTPG